MSRNGCPTDVYLKVEDGSDTQQSTNSRIFKVSAVLIGGACLVLVSIAGMSMRSEVAESTDLVGMPTSLRSSVMKGNPMGALANLPAGPGPWKELTLAALESANRCGDRDVSAAARGKFNSIMAQMDKKDLAVMAKMKKAVQSKAGQLAGSYGGDAADAPYGLVAGMVSPVKGFWDPFSLSTGLTEGELLFFREAEIKHGRVCMLAALGFWTQENFHPLFGGNIDVPAIQSISQVDLILFWPIAFVVLGIPEVAGLGRIDYSAEGAGFTPELAPGEVPGAIGFDPLKLTPDDPAELLKRQNQELLHGRLAMIAAAGMIAQELLTQSKLNEGGVFNEVTAELFPR